MIGLNTGHRLTLNFNGIGMNCFIALSNERSISNKSRSTQKSQLLTMNLGSSHRYIYPLEANGCSTNINLAQTGKNDDFKNTPNMISKIYQNDSNFFGDIGIYTTTDNNLNNSTQSRNQSKTNTLENTSETLTIFGLNRDLVYQKAAQIAQYKKPEPYKGKGIRYINEKFFEKKKDQDA